MTNIEYAESLRQLAAFYEAHPEMPAPHPTITIFTYSREAFLKAAVELAKGGRIEKLADDPDGTYPCYHARRMFGGIRVDVDVPRSTVCRLVTPAVYECPDSLLEESKEYAEAT